MKEATADELRNCGALVVSIHAPVKEATIPQTIVDDVKKFRSTPP